MRHSTAHRARAACLRRSLLAAELLLVSRRNSVRGGEGASLKVGLEVVLEVAMGEVGSEVAMEEMGLKVAKVVCSEVGFSWCGKEG